MNYIKMTISQFVNVNMENITILTITGFVTGAYKMSTKKILNLGYKE